MKSFLRQTGIFPCNMDQEISVMFIKGVEKDEGNLQFGVNSVGLGQPETFYSLSAAASASNDTSDTEEATDEDTTTVGSGDYQCMSAAFPITYTGSYEGLKDFIVILWDIKYRMNISSFNIAYNSQDDVYQEAFL